MIYIVCNELYIRFFSEFLWLYLHRHWENFCSQHLLDQIRSEDWVGMALAWAYLLQGTIREYNTCLRSRSIICIHEIMQPYTLPATNIRLYIASRSAHTEKIKTTTIRHNAPLTLSISSNSASQRSIYSVSRKMTNTGTRARTRRTLNISLRDIYYENYHIWDRLVLEWPTNNIILLLCEISIHVAHNERK